MGRPRKTENQLTKDDLLKNKDGVIKNLQEMCSDLVNDNLELIEINEELKAENVFIKTTNKRDNIVNIVVTAIITIACCMLFIGIIGK